MNKLLKVIDSGANLAWSLIEKATKPLAIGGMLLILSILLLATIMQFYIGSLMVGFILLSLFCFFSLLVRGAFL